MSCTLTLFEVVTVRPAASSRVLTVLAGDGDDAIDRLYRSEQLLDNEIPVTCRPAGRRVTPPPLCGAPQPDGTVVTISMTDQQRRALYRWLAITAVLITSTALAIDWLTR